MAKTVFEIVIDTDDLDPEDRLYYEYVGDNVAGIVTKQEIDAALKEIYDQMTAPCERFETRFHSWFYHRLSEMYDLMADTLWDAIDTYVQDELYEHFKNVED